MPDDVRLMGCGSGFRWLAKVKFAAHAIWECFRARQRLIFCGHSSFLPFRLILKRLFRVEYVLIAHGIEAWQLRGKPEREGVARARLVLSVSRFTQDQLLCQVSSAQVALLPNCVDTGRFRPAPKPTYLLERHGIKTSHVLLTVGRVSASEGYKGHDMVLCALPLVLQQYPGVHYVTAGACDGLDRLNAQAEALGIASRVTFTGGVAESELVDYYNLCDLFLMPSTGEGFGIVFLEALACGKAVAGNRDGSCEALLDRKLGLLVPLSVQDVAAAI